MKLAKCFVAQAFLGAVPSGDISPRPRSTSRVPWPAEEKPHGDGRHRDRQRNSEDPEGASGRQAVRLGFEVLPEVAGQERDREEDKRDDGELIEARGRASGADRRTMRRQRDTLNRAE